MTGLTSFLFSLCLLPQVAAEHPVVLVVQGAPGTAEYKRQFDEWVQNWERAATAGEATFLHVGGNGEASTSDRERLQTVLSQHASGGSELWLVLIGHGTYDYRAAKLNLRGPDVSAAELREWLQPMRRPLAVINCTSSSAPFLQKLSGENRVVVTATRSGFEQNFARFGAAMSQAILDPAADLDKDDQTSLLEAWLSADRQTQASYQHEGRLATEHSLLDDNGDGKGTPADWFRGLQRVKKSAGSELVDGLRAAQFHLVRSEKDRQLTAAQRTRRAELELAIHRLKARKRTFSSEDEYYNQLEKHLLEMAAIYGSSR